MWFQQQQAKRLTRQIEGWVNEMIQVTLVEEWGNALARLLVDWANNYGVIFSKESLEAVQHWMAREQDLALQERELAEGRRFHAAIQEAAKAAAEEQGIETESGTVHFKCDLQTGEFVFWGVPGAEKKNTYPYVSKAPTTTDLSGLAYGGGRSDIYITPTGGHVLYAADLPRPTIDDMAHFLLFSGNPEYVEAYLTRDLSRFTMWPVVSRGPGRRELTADEKKLLSFAKDDPSTRQKVRQILRAMEGTGFGYRESFKACWGVGDPGPVKPGLGACGAWADIACARMPPGDERLVIEKCSWDYEGRIFVYTGHNAIRLEFIGEDGKVQHVAYLDNRWKGGWDHVFFVEDLPSDQFGNESPEELEDESPAPFVAPATWKETQNAIWKDVWDNILNDPEFRKCYEAQSERYRKYGF